MTLAGSATVPPSVAAARLLQVVEHEFAEGLEAARSAVALSPRADAESLRRAYLELLKLALCDLCGTTTASVARTQDGVVMSRELSGEQLRMRAAGLDWPLHGLTMVGLTRLDDLQACVEQIVGEGVEGDLIEAGCWRGGASMLMRATLDTLGGPARTVHVADSFQGFPASDDARGEDGAPSLSLDLAGCDFLAVPEAEVRDNFARFGLSEGVAFLPGFFQDTLPALSGHRWALVRLDGDTYEATLVALRALYPGVQQGGYVIVDDYVSLEECHQAVDDFRREQGIEAPLERVDWNSARWRRADAPAGVDAAVPQPSGVAAPRAVQRQARERVPTIEEVELAEELERARREIAYLTGSPLRGPARWMRTLAGAR